MVMRVVFVYPYFDYRGPDKFPIGIAYLASIAKRFADVKVIDESIERTSAKQILKQEPDVVCFSATTPAFPSAYKLAKEIKAMNNDVKIIFGGVHATFKPEDALRCSDIVVRGEGEITLKEILEGKGLEKIKGISFKNNGCIVHNRERELIENLDSLPFPAYEFFDLKKYKVMSVITSRGCVYKCSYCCATRLWKCRVRFRSSQNVIEELRMLKELNVKRLKIQDSTFNLNEKRALEICKLMRKESLDFEWSCEVRADHLTERLVKEMKKSGCVLLCIGVDSGSQSILDANKREMKVQDIIKAFELAKKYDIKTRAYVTFGLKGETRKSVEDTIKLLRKIKPTQIMLSLATAYPGTELKPSGYAFPENWVRMFSGHGRGAQLYVPETLSKEEYMRLAEYMLEEIKKLSLLQRKTIAKTLNTEKRK